jgi:hypothetical protein
VVSHRTRRGVIFRYRVIIDFRENVDLNHNFWMISILETTKINEFRISFKYVVEDTLTK